MLTLSQELNPDPESDPDPQSSKRLDPKQLPFLAKLLSATLEIVNKIQA
jgi:hypothetical protein